MLWLLIRRTAFGLFLESVGGNPAAAKIVGINARLIIYAAYLISGFCSGWAGIVLAADTHTSDPVSIGLYIELDAILAVVIGGGSLAGGRVYLGMTLLGVLVIQALTTSILTSGLPPEYNLVVKAVVVIIVLLLQSTNLRGRAVQRFREDEAMNEKYLPLLATISVFVALFLIGGFLYNNFLSTLVLGDILADNAFIITAAIGTTFVILSGGIDLSVGSMIGFVGVVIANLDLAGWHPLVSAAMMLAFGLAFGALQGLIIDFCEIQPFIVTLAGLFLLRGGCFMINLEFGADSPPVCRLVFGPEHSSARGRRVAQFGVVMLMALVAAIAIAHFTRFGANVYAIGGDRTSATLMGVPMRRTTVGIYALGGFFSALGGVIYAFYTSSGYPLAGTGNELTAIASVVLGGTMLTGGIGMVAGTLFGGMILGLIATLIDFNGSLNGAWIMIISGVLLFIFIVMQRSLVGSLRLRGAA